MSSTSTSARGCSEEQGVDTVAGLVMKQLGRLPRRGESVMHRRLRVPRAARRPAPHRGAARARAARRAAAARRASGRRRAERVQALEAAAPAMPRARWRCARAARCSRCAGALLAAAFAPLNLWPLALLCPAVLMWLWQDAAPRAAARRGFWFGFGTFARRHLLAVHQRPRLRRRPVWLALMLMLGLVGHHGALPRGARLRRRALAAARAARCAGCVGAAGGRGC